jgi:cytochrome c556
MLLAVVLTLAAQEPFDLSPVMKDIGAIQNSLRINLTNDVAVGVAADAAKLQENFTKAMGFFKAMKAQDAVDVSRANADAAGQIVKAAKANNLEAAKAAAGNIQKSCKACHDIHREQLPDKTYKFK